MVDFIDEYFVRPMKFPDAYPPYNAYNTAIYALIALFAAYVIYKYLRGRKIPISPQFYFAVLPYIFLGGILRVIQDAQLLPRSIELFGITFYPFITPGIYILMFVVLVAVYAVSAQAAKADFSLLQKKMRDSGIGLAAALFAILALFGFSSLTVDSLILFLAILVAAGVGLMSFELFKRWFYNKRENGDLKNIERVTTLSQTLDGAATFIGVSYGGYFEQHLVANTIFSVFGSPFAFFVVKALFAIAIIMALRKEASNRDEQIFVLLLITIFGLAPGVRDALRLLFGV